EEQTPVDRPLLGEFVKSIQAAPLHSGENEEAAGESTSHFIFSRLERIVAPLQAGVQAVDRPNHRVPEAVRGRRKLDGHKGGFTPLVKNELRGGLPNGLVFPQMRQDVFPHTLATDGRQKIVDDDPLVVPTYQSLNIRE